MRTKYSKGLKPRFIKQMAMFMGICYMMNLLQYQISPILHSISHVLEIPDNMISHHSMSSSEYEIHDQGEHGAMQISHEHGIIDLLDSILESSKEEHSSDETIFSELKFDKHLSDEKYIKGRSFETKKIKLFLQRPQKLKRGHLQIFQEPPQFS